MPRPIDEELADVPAYKQRYFQQRDQAQNWRDFNLGLDRMRGMGSNERFAYRQINAAEGGGVPDASDPRAKGPAVGGLTAKTLSQLEIPGVAPDALPADLKPWQLPHGYRAYFDREFARADGAKTLDEIKHPGIAAFVADTSFRAGTNGSEMIQRAVNHVRKKQGLPTIAQDKMFGPETLEAVNQVTSSAGERRAFARELKKLRDVKYPGESLRTGHFFGLATKEYY